MAGMFTAYRPTVRDRVATALLGKTPGPLREKVVEGLIGSTGLGASGKGWLGTSGLVDFTPLGLAFAADEAGRSMGQGHPFRGALELATAVPLPIAKGAKAAGRVAETVAERVVPKAKPPITAYHGSPHQFDRFSMEHIGEGEGAQVYGHGLYFAENEAVARGYRAKLAGGQALPADVLAEYYAPGRIVQGYGGADKVVNFRPGPDGRPWDWSVDVVRVKPDGSPLPYERPRNHRTEPDRKLVEATLGRKLADPGHMYQVGINADPEHFLDWDAPLKAQPKAHGALAPHGATGMIANENAGEALRAIQDRLGKEETARVLREAGVPGVKYLDAGSRGAGNGTRNYVVFDDKLIDILKRYGIAAPALMGASAVYGAQQSGAK